MSETTALEKHACAACGAEGEWNPDKQALVCPFCGTVSPAELADGEVREIDLVQTLRDLPDDDRGWQAPKLSVRCQACDAVSVFDQGQIGKNCEFCGSTKLVDYSEIKAPIRPVGILPFIVDNDAARPAARRWLGSRWFAPGKLKKRVVESLRGIYIPYWTFDAHAFCRWNADAGFYYYTTESYTDGKGRQRTRRVRHVRWRPMRGLIEHFFDDEPIPGTRGVDPELLSRIEPFPTEQLEPYDTAYLAGFVVEHYQVVLFDAFERAREAMIVELKHLATRDIPGDTHRNLHVEPEFSKQTFKHILVPVWLASYRSGSKTYQLVVNGSTAEVAGRYPKSVWKILFAVLAAAAAIGAVILLSR